MIELDLNNKNIKEFDKYLKEIKNRKKIKKLYLNNNKIRSLPKDLSFFTNLEYIDLSKNPITSINYIIDGLKSLPKLKEITLTLDVDNNLKEYLANELNKLEIINGVKIKNNKNNNNFIKKEENLNKDYNYNKDNEIGLLLECISQLFSEKNKNINLNEFDSVLKNKMKNYTKNINKDSSFEFLKSINHFSQIDTIQFILRKLSQYFVSFGDSRISNILQLCNSLIEFNCSNLFNIIQENNLNFLNNTDNNYCIWENKKIEVSNCHERLYNLSKYKKDFENSESLLKKSIDIRPFNNLTNIKNLKFDKKEKTIPIKLLKEYITEIYDQKIWYDQKHLEAKLPRETMEQFLHQYLKNKFGLKSLIKENLINFINSIEKFSETDINIKIFGLVLSNKLDEEFRFSISQIKKSIRSLLQININSRYKNDTINKKQSIYKSKISSYIDLEESLEIINYVYSENTVEQLTNLINNEQENLTYKKNDRRYLNNTKTNKKVIKFSKYESIIISYFLNKHLSFLQPFNKLFNCYDSDEDGILTEEEFLNLINNIKFSETYEIDSKKILYYLDPYNNKIINYSSLVTILSDIMLDPNEQYTIMHYIYEKFK